MDSAECPLDPRRLPELDEEEREQLLKQAVEEISEEYLEGGSLYGLWGMSEEDLLDPADCL